MLYGRHCKQFGIQKRDVLQLCKFSVRLTKSLMFANKPAQCGRPLKRRSIEEAPNRRQSKAAAVPTPGHDVRFDSVVHWPVVVDSKDYCRLYQAYV